MKSQKLIITILIVLVVIAGIVGVSYQNRSCYTIESTTPLFEEKLSEFTEVAEKFGNEFLGSFCKRDDTYRVKGDYFNLAKNTYLIGGGPLGGSREVTYDELLQNVHLTDEQFNYYKDFLDRTPYIQCIDFLLINKFTGIEFHLPYSGLHDVQQGFVYTFRGSPQPQEYGKLQSTQYENWSIFIGRK